MIKTSQTLIGCAAFAASLLVISPTIADAAVKDPEIQLVRAGDREMACEALATEINQLASADAAPKKKKRGGMGFLKALSFASPMLGMGGGMGGAIASQAAGMAAQEAATSQMNDAMDASMNAMNPNGGSIAQQRKARLTTIFEEKGC